MLLKEALIRLHFVSIACQLLQGRIALIHSSEPTVTVFFCAKKCQQKFVEYCKRRIWVWKRINQNITLYLLSKLRSQNALVNIIDEINATNTVYSGYYADNEVQNRVNHHCAKSGGL